MRGTLYRIMAIWIGIAVMTALYGPYSLALETAQPSVRTLFGALVLTAVLLGLVIELVPWPRKFAPAWGRITVSVALLGLLFYVHTFGFVLAVGLKVNPVVRAMLENRWVAPVLGVLLGNLVGKALTRDAP